MHLGAVNKQIFNRIQATQHFKVRLYSFSSSHHTSVPTDPNLLFKSNFSSLCRIVLWFVCLVAPSTVLLSNMIFLIELGKFIVYTWTQKSLYTKLNSHQNWTENWAGWTTLKLTITFTLKSVGNENGKLRFVKHLFLVWSTFYFFPL